MGEAVAAGPRVRSLGGMEVSPSVRIRREGVRPACSFVRMVRVRAMVGLLLFAASLSVGTSTLLAQQDDSSKVGAKKLPNPTAAMVRSWVFPGWGQWYNGKKWKAAAVFTAEMGLVAYAVYEDWLASQATSEEDRFYYEDRRNLALWWLAGVALFSGLDAYVDAHLAGFDVSENLSLGPCVLPAPGVTARLKLGRIQ